ncbi:hypothetical protein CRUP_019438 [Coryphaenoides rupestris]|nr:hypothetical protein CRUP_019438 [Coryphaenoides rupestris]
MVHILPGPQLYFKADIFQILHDELQDFGDVAPEATRICRIPRAGKTPFLLAAEHGQLEVFEYLIGMGCTHGPKDKEGNTALHLAAKRGFCEMLRKLLEIGLDVDDTNFDGLTALHLAVDEDHITCVELLLRSGCNVNTQNNVRSLRLYLVNGLHLYSFTVR